MYLRVSSISIAVAVTVQFVMVSAAAQVSDGLSAAAPVMIGESKPVQQVQIEGKSAVETARGETIAKTVITGAELARYGESNVAEAMKRVPGVLVVGTTMSLKGMAASYTQILIDGEAPRGVAVADMPMSMIERVAESEAFKPVVVPTTLVLPPRRRGVTAMRWDYLRREARGL